MKNYFEEISKKLNDEIDIEDVEIIDNSHKHKGHRSYSPEKFHLHLKIKSSYLKTVMKVLSEDLKTKIHALEISIEK